VADAHVKRACGAADRTATGAASEGAGGSIAALAKEIAERRAILFAGAGLSAGLGLPDWDAFLVRLGEQVGLDAREIRVRGTDFRLLTEYVKLERGSIDDLHDWMRRDWRVDDGALRASATHRAIVELDFPLVYTTNYDHFIERAYALHGRRCNRIVTAADFARVDPALPTIVKFHGDLDDVETLVVAETDYFRRLAFQDPLDIKLSADAFGATLLFVGYSVSDVNLRLLLYRLCGLWQHSGHRDLRPRSYVFMGRANRLQQRILDSWGVAAFVADDGDDEGRSLQAFLERLCRAVAGVRAGHPS